MIPEHNIMCAHTVGQGKIISARYQHRVTHQISLCLYIGDGKFLFVVPF